MPISTRRQAAASSTDGSRKIREGKDFEKGCYEFEGPNRDTDGGGCFSGVVRVDKCTRRCVPSRDPSVRSIPEFVVALK